MAQSKQLTIWAAILFAAILVTAQPQPAFAQELNQTEINRIRVKYRTANELYAQKKYQEALSRINELEQLSGNNRLATAVNLKIKILVALGRFDKAQEELNNLYALEIGPEIETDIATYEPKIKTGLARLEAKRKREQAALERARKARIAKQRKADMEKKRKLAASAAVRRLKANSLAQCVDGESCFLHMDLYGKSGANKAVREKRIDSRIRAEELVDDNFRKQLLTKSCNFNFQRACYFLGREYRTAQSGRLIENSCRNGLGEACIYLGDVLPKLTPQNTDYSWVKKKAPFAPVATSKQAALRAEPYLRLACLTHRHAKSCERLYVYLDRKTFKYKSKDKKLIRNTLCTLNPKARWRTHPFVKSKNVGCEGRGLSKSWGRN